MALGYLDHVDDRGRQCRIPSPVGPLGSSIPSERLLRLWEVRTRMHTRPRPPWLRFGGAGICGVLAALVLILGTRAGVDVFGKGLVVVAAILLGAGVLWASVGARSRRPDRRVLADFVGRYRLCVVCAYDLAALPPEEDGCLVCPECGAAWKLPAGPGDS